METYKASLDTTAKVATGAIFLMAAFGIAMSFINDDHGAYSLFLIIIISTLLLTYIFSVRFYRITDDKLIIKRPIPLFDKVIALSEIESVEILTKEDFKGTIRTAGNGGLFGYTGYYSNNKLGSFKMYATNGKNRMLIILKNNKKKIIVSPDDLGMVDMLNILVGKQK